jgi:AbrB family looped-hinge helix DNA binding protein
MTLRDKIDAIYNKVVTDPPVKIDTSNFKTRSMDNIGRLTIPKQYRDSLHITQDDELKVILSDDKIIITKQF